MGILVFPGKGVLPPKPILPAKRNFPDFLAAYRKYTRNHEATAKVHMWTGISILGAALERKVWLERDYYKVYPNLYTFIIGAPGLVKKSTATAIGVDLLRELATMNIMAEKLSASSLIEALANSYSTFRYDERDIKQSASFCYASELMVMMEEVCGSLTDLLTTFYDCQPNNSEKPWVYSTRSHGEVSVFGPCLNFLGCSTQSWLRRAIPPEQMEGGFASRILFVIENELPDRFVAIPEIDPELADMRGKLIEDLNIIHSLRGRMQQTKATYTTYVDWYESYMKSLHARRNNTKFSGYYGRKGAHIEKLSMIASISEGDSLIIEQRHLLKAIAWVEQLERSMLDGFASVGRNPLADSAINVLKYIQQAQRATLGEISSRFFNDLSADDLRKVLEQLVQMNQISLVLQGSKPLYIPVTGAASLQQPESNIAPEPTRQLAPSSDE
jgi:hypothetical protein